MDQRRFSKWSFPLSNWTTYVRDLCCCLTLFVTQNSTYFIFRLLMVKSEPVGRVQMIQPDEIEAGNDKKRLMRLSSGQEVLQR